MSTRTEISRRPLPRTLLRLGLLAGAVALVVGRWGVPRALGLVGDAVVVVFILYLVRHLLFLASALGGRSPAIPGPAPETVPGRASVLVSCRDEELVVEGLVAALDRLEAPDGGLEVILVNDRSTDRTGELLDEAAASRPDWQVLHRAPEAAPGKSAALNAATVLTTGDALVIFDADHQPDPDTVRRLLARLAEPGVVAVQGRCRVGNPRESPLARLVALDYLCGYLVNMVGRDRVFSLPAYGGANGAVDAEAVRLAGGWNERSVTEDTDITLRLLLAGGRVAYEPAAVDTEQAVATLPRFWRQRYRWARGHQQVCTEQRAAVLTSRHLGPLERIETLLFLHSFHVPVACLVAVLLVLSRSLGVSAVDQHLDPWPLIPLMLAAPTLEIGGGLILAGVRRRRALDLLLFPVLYLVSMLVCTKAWIDGLVGRGYGWAKTARSPVPVATS